MEANAIADTLIEKFGKRWYFLTPDYVYGYCAASGIRAQASRAWRHMGGRCPAARHRRLLPILDNAGAFRPHVLIDLMGGEDQANSLRQIVRFGLIQDMAVGGALFELESILAVPDAARIGWWTMEWWWNQPDVPRSRPSTRQSGAGPARRRAHGTGSAMPPSIRWRVSPIRKNPWIRWSSRARCRDTRCPLTSRSNLTACFSASATTSS